MKNFKNLLIGFTIVLACAMLNISAIAECNYEYMNSSGNELVRLCCFAPEEVSIGEEFQSEIIVCALQQAGNIVVRQKIPKGLKFIKSIPEAKQDKNILVWKFSGMAQCEKKVIKVWFKMVEEGCVVSCATVAALPRACFVIKGTKPVLEIEKTGPETAMLGDEIIFDIVVRNTGSGTARDVVITDILPKGFVHESGVSEVECQIGDLEPGTEQCCSVKVRAVERGRICNKAIVESSNAAKKQAKACTQVMTCDISLTKTGPQEQYLGKKATYILELKNTGDIPLECVKLCDITSCNTEIIEAKGAEVNGNTAVWWIEELLPGEKVTKTLTLTSHVPGIHGNYSKACIPCKKVEDCVKTLWKGRAALLIEAVDTNDPLMIGEETTYIIKVTNQGTAKDTAIKVIAVFAEELIPISASGASESKIIGSKVIFKPYAELDGKETILFKICAKGVSAGDGRVKISLMTDLINNSIVEEESTHVY